MTRVKNSATFPELNVFKKHSTASLYELFLPTALQIDRYLTLTSFVLGIIGNTISIIVWWHPRLRMKEAAVLTFVFISVLDLLYLLLALIQDFERVWSTNVFVIDGFCKIFKVLQSSCEFYSILLTMLICIQHIVSLKNPDSYEYYKNRKWTYLITFLLAVVSILFSIAEGVFSFIDNENTQMKECLLPRDILSTSKSYKVYYWLVKFFLTSIFIVSISGLCIYILHRSGMEKDRSKYFHNENCTLTEKGYCKCTKSEISNVSENCLSLTKSVIIVGFFAVFIGIPQLIAVSLEPLNNFGDVKLSDFEVLDDPIWERYFNIEGAKIIFYELYLTKFSLKIFIYFFCTKQFRKVFIEIFGIKNIFATNLKTQRSPERKSSLRTKTKPISYYIDRSKNSYPFEKNQTLYKDSNINCNTNKSSSHPNPVSQVNVNNIRRVPKIQTLERRNARSQTSQKIEPIYYSVPWSTPSRHHKHCCRKSLQINEIDVNTKNEKKPKIIPKKEFHNVCSEFEYYSPVASSSSDESPRIFVKNCHCNESSGSETNSDKYVLKYKKYGKRLHQV